MTTSSPSPNETTVRIGGMTCDSCEILLERTLRALPGILEAHVNRRSGTARVRTEKPFAELQQAIFSAIHKAGYRSIDGPERPAEESANSSNNPWLEIGGALITIFAIYKILSAYDIVSLAPSTSGALTFGGIFVIGLVAGASSCLAVTGGLLLAVAAKYNETHRSSTGAQRVMPLLHFNIGRLISYFLLGGLAGWLGQSIALSTKMTGYMTIVVALVMLYLALTILKIIPKGSFPIRLPNALAHRIARLSETDHPLAPFALGALTFFLPCGFTQSLQLAALASGSFQMGAFTMFFFALGTLPALLGVSLVSSLSHGSFSRIFLRFSGTLVLVLALFNIRSGLTLLGYTISLSDSTTGKQQVAAQQLPPPPVQEPAPTPQAPSNQAQVSAPAGLQQISMKVSSYSYDPEVITLQAGVPVRWIIDASNASGCTSGLVVPDLGIQRILKRGENVIEFTAPSTPGKIAFSCSMGMVRGVFIVH
ncbi:MAG: sulfite exporter TauE/SafE family protein [Candidatus Peribacteraceae bacterium]|nr:sulfite exporter TauE/SafE family protein [Candidatus Peribacteraceae bacterium]